MKYRLLSDVADYVSERINTRELHLDDYVSTENMLPEKAGVVIANNLPTVEFVTKYRPKDILTSNIRPYFKKIWYSEKFGGCSNDVLVIRAKRGTHPRFLYYVLSDDNFFKYSVGTSKGTKMPRGDKTAIMQYNVPCFSEATQESIAAILSSLDDKIELNNRIIANLEAQAQAIFKSWFVDFEPFQDGEFEDSELGMIPKGWKVGTLEELVDIRYGKDHKKLGDGSIPVYGSGGIMRYADESIYSNESVLIPRKGTLNNVLYVTGQFWTVDTMFYTVMKKNNVAKFVYQFVRSLDLASMNSGSAVPSMTTNILNAIKLVIPKDEIFEDFETVVSPMYTAMKQLESQNSKLCQTRDTLLPKLISGEIEVPVEG